jgi:two-component system, cell cycle response regulator DivK
MERQMPKTVLIVEDNELNMKLFNDLVETRGHRIVQTRSGIEAVDLARKHRPDLILMDIQLPEVSGLEVTQWLKDDEELRTIPVVAVTAFAMKGDEEKIRQGGCEAYLSKPISVARFFETIDHFLGPGAKQWLVVDDVQPDLKLLQTRLSTEYFEVLTATNGLDAIAICEMGGRDIVW